MCRSFTTDPVDPTELHQFLDLARRAPSAGFTHGIEFLALTSPQAVQGYWDTTLPPDARTSFPWPGLLRAPVLVVVMVRPDAWVQRYGEADKASTGLGADAQRWQVPYWWVDSGAVIQNLLLLVEDAGLGALFFGVFEHELAVRRRFDVPEDFRCVGVVAVGYPDGPRTPSASVRNRSRPAISDIVHVDGWDVDRVGVQTDGSDT